MSTRRGGKCECGGQVRYVVSFGRKFSWCETCTPVVTVKVKMPVLR